jgi:hypothetical protein
VVDEAEEIVGHWQAAALSQVVRPTIVKRTTQGSMITIRRQHR